MDKPNFEFEFRDSVQFKNVPAPVKCYYLLANTDRDEQAAPDVITDEPEQQMYQYQFMMPRTTDTPPATPLLAGTLEYASPDANTNNLAQFLSHSMAEGAKGCPMFGGVPDLNVIKPTPTSTPNPTPPCSRKNSQTNSPPATCPAHAMPSTSTPPPLVTTTILINSPPPDADPPQGFDGAPHHHHPHTSFMTNMRNISMTPLTEDINEEVSGSGSGSTPNADEGIDIPQRKLSEASNCSTGSCIEFTVPESSNNVAETSSSASKPPTRKISDVSSHSGESGIESTTSKVSDTSKDGLPEYKLTDGSKEGFPLDRESTSGAVADREVTPKEELSPDRQLDERKLSSSSSGSTEEELMHLRSKRAGSVSKAVERYDTLTRHRKSGLPTVIHGESPSNVAGTQHNGQPESQEQRMWSSSGHSPSSSTVSSSM